MFYFFKSFYKNSLKELLLSYTKEQFDLKLALNKTKHLDEFGREVPAWDQGFINYFLKNILIDIDSIAKYAIFPICEQYFSDISGITTNVGEGLNNLMHAMLEEKLMPVDTVVSVMHFLSIYYCNEIKRGFCNIGEFKLKPEFLNLKQRKDELEGELRPTLGPKELRKNFNKNKDEPKELICSTISISSSQQSSYQESIERACKLPDSDDSDKKSIDENENTLKEDMSRYIKIDMSSKGTCDCEAKTNC